MWPDWAIYWTLYSILKLLATINLPKSATFLGNFCKGVKIFHFSSEINFGQLFKTFGNFFWSHCEWVFTDLRYFIQYFFSICRSRDLHKNTSTHTTKSTSLIDFFSSNLPPQTERLFDTINQKHEPHRPTNICFPLKDLHFSPHDKSNQFEATASREPATAGLITSPMRPRERGFYDESNWLFSEYETA